MNKHATFWRYDGNHSAGRDQDRQDPHGLGLELIAAMAYWGDGGDYPAPITYEDTLQIQVKHSKKDSFGHEVSVKAPTAVWQKGKEALESVKF